MTPSTQHGKAPAGAKWKRRLRIAALAAIGPLLAPCLAVWTGLADHWARRLIVRQLETMTGGRVELGGFHFHLLRLRAELAALTIHGSEPKGAPPLFHADELFVDIRLESFWRRKIALSEVRVERPAVHLRWQADGRSNLPARKPAGPPGRRWSERIFALAIGRLRINDGTIQFNDARVPLAVEGGEFEFALDSHSGTGGPFYRGRLNWRQMILAAGRYLPFPSDVSLSFNLERDALEVNQLRWKLLHSELDLQAALASFTRPDWSFRYRGKLGLEDMRTILRKHNAPGGQVEFTGEGRYAGGQVGARGHYAAREIDLPYVWFHSAGLSSRGSYRADNQRLEVPDFEARALGGLLQGKVNLEFDGLKFRVDSRAHGMSLAAILAAVNNAGFPVATLHWNAAVDVNAVTTWVADFKHLESRGLSLWAPALEPRDREIPVSARLDYHYVMDASGVFISPGGASRAGQPSHISTPTSHVEFGGMLGADDSALDLKLDAQDLKPWDDFINRLRGADAEPAQIAGRTTWQGRVLGPLRGPTITGHFKGSQARFNQLYWDEVEGDLSYSPGEFRLQRARAVLGQPGAGVPGGRSSADLDLWLALRAWGFRPESQWSLEVNLVRAATDRLQELFGWSYPARGVLTGQFRGRGTRADPELTGLFDVADVSAWGFRFDRARGQLGVRRDEIRISNAELRTFPASPQNRGTASGGTRPLPAGVITGNFLYRLPGQEVAFDLTGAVIPLEGIERIQTPRLPLGGQLSFQLRGQGPILAPTSQGSLRLVDLRVGREVLGSFQGKLDSNGQRVHVELGSAISAGRVQGQLDLTLGRDYPLQGDVTVQGVDLDPFIQAGFHLEALTGHSAVDGRIRIDGALASPETIIVQAELSRIVFDYEYVKLENVGPLRVSYRRDEVRIDQANLRGTDTDLRLAGFARFTGDRRLGLNLAGTVNLRLAGGFVPGLEARGPAQVNAAVEGTFANPRITGKVRVENASATYGDFPTGLSQVTGEFVFDTSRLLFENLTAQAGGGQLLLGGSVSYGDGPLRYDISARSAQTRIRYPEGMSWLVGGSLRLSGTMQAALLSGRLEAQRVLMTRGFDVTSILIASKEPVRAPSTSSPFLRNLQFDIEAVTSPDARLEWTGARFDIEGSLRVRGTWEHPIFLGHIHLLSGGITFRGNRYRVTRGDVNFANPFRLDPAVNIEATTNISQYEITLNFTGTASHLTLAYRSDPPLPTNDIIALLALGSTSQESQLRGPTGGQSPELGATSLVSEAISSQLGGRLERLFGIRRFRLDPALAGTGNEQNAGARVTVEQQVTRDLVITYSSNVTSTQQQVIQVEYAVSRDVSIIALRDQNGTFGLDVKFKKRFK